MVARFMALPMPLALRRAEERVGSVLADKWRLEKLLGVGGMASVYAATHRNKKRVAIKMLHPQLSLDLAVRERFLREGYVANSVAHPGAVAVHDDEVADDGSAFLVMELLDGETIDARWRRKGKLLSPVEVLSVADQVLDTLAAAHAKGIVHRDIKPENLFLTRDGSIKILDFGIARVLERANANASATEIGRAMGTPAFMAPEQARGRWDDVDARTDLWALGATMYMLLTGEFVHGPGTANEMLALAVTRPAPSIGSRRRDLQPALAQIVDRALSYHKSERWPDALSMQNAVRIAYAQMQGSDLGHALNLSIPDLAASAASKPGDSFSDQSTLTAVRGVAAVDMSTITSMSTKRARNWGIAGVVALFASLLVSLVIVAMRRGAEPQSVATGRESHASLPEPAAPKATALPTEHFAEPIATASGGPDAVQPTSAKPAAAAKVSASAARRPLSTAASVSKKAPPADPFARRR